MVCYQEWDRIEIKNKYDLRDFAEKHEIADPRKPIVDGRFDLNVSNIREICARLDGWDIVVFEQDDYFVIMDIGV